MEALNHIRGCRQFEEFREALHQGSVGDGRPVAPRRVLLLLLVPLQVAEHLVHTAQLGLDSLLKDLLTVQLLEPVDQLLDHELKQDHPQWKLEGAGILLFLFLPLQSGLIQTREDAGRCVGLDEQHVSILRGRN